MKSSRLPSKSPIEVGTKCQLADDESFDVMVRAV